MIEFTTVKDDIKTALLGVFEYNKMSPGKQNTLLEASIEKEINHAHKVYCEKAEINRKYTYLTSVKELRKYPISANILDIFSVTFIFNTDSYPLKKIYKEELLDAGTISNDGIAPSFYDDYTEPGYLKIYPTADVDGASFEMYHSEQVATLVDGDNLSLPEACYDDFRDYLICRFMIMYGYMVDEKLNAMQLLKILKSDFIKSADKYRREKAFKNPDRAEFAEGSYLNE